jgi:predicted  nucleic acid-binding Zn-ribbon protein
MVLSELERHEEKQDHLQKDLVELRLLVAKIATELNQNTTSIQDLVKQIRSSEQSSAGIQTDITLLKYKIGVVASAISTGLTLLVQVGMKYLEHLK